MTKNDLYKSNKKWYRNQWFKITIKYAVPDLLKQIKIIKSYFL